MPDKIDNAILKYADFILKWRWAVIILSLLVAGVFASGMPNLSFSNNYRVFFSEANPELKAFEQFQNTYTKNDNILFVLQPADKDLTKQYMAEVIETITEKSWQIPYSIRVDSVTNFQHSKAVGFDDLEVNDLIRDGAQISEAELDQRWQTAKDEPLLYGFLTARDMETTGINVTLQYPEKSLSEVPEAVGKARQIKAEIEAAYPDIHIALTGVSMMNASFAEAGQGDAATLTPLMYLILILVMAVALRSLSATLTSVLVIGFSGAVAMGWAGHVGISLTPISVTAPTVILTLAIADSIHVLISMISHMREGQDKREALRNALRINFMPVTITSITTIVGFLALNTLDTPPFHDLGNITAVGIAAAWAYSLSFLPAMMSLLPMKVKQVEGKSKGLTGLLDKYAEFVIAKRRSVLVTSSLVAVILIAMIPRIEINDQWVEYFDYSIPFRGDAEFGMNELTGVYLIEFSIPANGAGGVNEPEYLASLAAFTDYLRATPGVEHVYSYSDIIKRLNKNMHGDDESWYRIPEDRELAAQYNLLYEISLPYGLDLNDRIDIDKAASRVTVTLGNLTTRETREFNANAEAWLRENTPDYMHTMATGPTVMFSHISERNIHGMLRGNAVAIIIISILLMVSLRSIGMGALSLIPNAVPILMTFGLWAVTFANIGMAAAGVSAVALGIVVDDTVHFLSKYLRARREKGMNQQDAVRYAFHTVGVALVVTTIILTLGFLVMAMSSFQVNEQLGLMTAATMIIALIVDFTLLPALLMMKKNKPDEQKELSDEKTA